MESSENIQNQNSDSWQRFQKGDHSALGDIFHDLYKELYYYGLKLVSIPDLVKDTIQDVFVEIWSRKQKMNEVNNIKAYLFVAIRRDLLRRIDKLRQENLMTDPFSDSFVFSTEDFIVQKETDLQLTQVLLQSLKKLTERQREVILLRFNHELDFHDLALVMEMNTQSVRNLLFRALEKIRKDMKSIGFNGVSDVEVFLLSVFQKIKLNISKIK